MPTRCGIAFGSNLGDRLANLREARRALLAALDAPGTAVFSPLYAAAPVDCPPGSPPFLNGVAEIEFDGSPTDLLDLCQSIERGLGRPDGRPKNAPRSVDLDLIYCGDLVLDTPRLTLPHPLAAERLFVLQPLADIRPDLVLPGQFATCSDLRDAHWKVAGKLRCHSVAEGWAP